MLAYRTSVQEYTGHKPFQLVFGSEVRLPVSVLPHIVHLLSSTKYARHHLDRACRQVRELYLDLKQKRQKVHYGKLCNE